MSHPTLACALLALAPLLTAPAAAQCGQAGSAGIPQISTSAAVWDTTVAFRLESAAPGAPWLWLGALTSGPTPLPFGTLCLDAAAFTMFNGFAGAPPVGLDGSVEVGLAFGTNLLAAVELQLAMQALVIDFGAPGFIAISNALDFELEAPRLALLSNQGALDLVHATDAAQGPAVLGGVDTGSPANFVLSSDATRAYVRITQGSGPHGVAVYDLSSATPALLGEALANTPGLSGKPRNGVVLSSDDSVGWFVDDAFVHRFDADPNSPSFLDVTGSGVSSVAGIDIAVSDDDKLLFVCAGTGSPSAVSLFDADTLVESGSIALTDAQGLLGFVLRYDVEVSPDGRFLAVLQQGAYVGVPSLDGHASLSVVSIDPNSPAYLQELVFVPLTSFGQTQVAWDPADLSSSRLTTLASDSAGEVVVQDITWTTGLVVETALGVDGATGVEAGGLGFSASGSYLYVAERASDTLHVLDSARNLLASWPLTSDGASGYVRVQ